jgi:hypothetical protein
MIDDLQANEVKFTTGKNRGGDGAAHGTKKAIDIRQGLRRVATGTLDSYWDVLDAQLRPFANRAFGGDVEGE